MTSKVFLHKFERQETISGPLAGVTIAVKDNLMVKNEPVTAGSKILKGHIAAYDATVIKRLLASGARLVGKTNLDEFAMGSSNENSAFGPVSNPWNDQLVPGGSSGGSATAVALGLVDASLGSDTGGSIRQPAAFCGVTGLKPTYGAVSRYGLIAMASSLDCVGPIARSAAEVERLFAAIVGQDENDQTSIDYQYQARQLDLADLKIGLPKEFWSEQIVPEIRQANEGLVAFLRDSRAEIISVSLPTAEFALPAYYIIMPAEVMANMARFDGIRFYSSQEADSLEEIYLKTRTLGFGDEVKRRVMLGAYVLSTGHYDDYYQKARDLADKISDEYQQVFKKVDLLVHPTTPTLPFELNSKTSDPVAMYQSDLLTVSANLAGLPALSLPVGFSKSRLPIGGQIVAAKKNEATILAVAKAYQQATDWHQQRPEPKNG